MYISSYFATFSTIFTHWTGILLKKLWESRLYTLNKNTGSNAMNCSIFSFGHNTKYLWYQLPNNWMTEEVKIFNTCQSHQHFSLSAVPCKRPMCRELDLPKFSLWSIVSTCTEQRFHRSQNKTTDNSFF